MNNITPREKFEKWLSEIRFPEADFLGQQPDLILSAVKQWVADPTTQPWNVNWLLIGEVSRSNIYVDASNKLIWAEIGALAYEYTAIVEVQWANDCLLHAMTLRINAVLKHGSQFDGSVRDVRKIIDWGLQRSLTLEQAQAILEDEARASADKELFFGDLDRTRILLKLSEAGLFERDNDLNEWAKIVDAWAHYLARPWKS